MNYWWVNQGQTNAQEIGGGYLWAPKLSSDGRKQQAYENMKDIEPGDLILAYSNQRVGHFGIAKGRAISASKPEEFGKKGNYWSDDGWLVNVSFHEIQTVGRDVIASKSEYLFKKFDTPLDKNLGVKQKYLFRISKEDFDFVMQLARISDSKISEEFVKVAPEFFVGEMALDAVVEKNIVQNTQIEATEKQALVLSRRGQGLFKDNLRLFESMCRLTKVEDEKLLVASHIKPWRSCTNTHERLDGNNGLLLTPTMDRLFDRRYLTFENSGDVVLSNKISTDVYEKIGLDCSKRLNVGSFREEQEKYLEYHRSIFLG